VRPSRPPRNRRLWFWLQIAGVAAACVALFVVVVLPLVTPMIFDGAGDPHLPPLLDAAAAAALIQSARAQLRGESPPAAAAGGSAAVIGAVVAIYNEDGPRAAAGCFGTDARQAVACAAGKLRPGAANFGEAPTDLVSLHLLRELRPATPLWLRDRGWGHSRGLYSTLLAGDEGARLLTDVQMHVGSYNVSRALEALEHERGVKMSGEAPKEGRFLIPTESWTEYEGKPVALYRASTILPPPDGKQIVEYCKLAGDYLAKIQQDDNKWLYEGDVGRDRYGKTYNTLRHAGTVYALYQLYEVTGVARYKDTADRGWAWLLEQIERENDEAGAPCAFVVERHTAESGGKRRTTYTVKLGGTGLTLLALAERLKVAPNDADLALGKALANHILRSQNPDGSFQDYWAYKTAHAKERRSEYYPGEAMLGLIRFYGIDPDPRYLAAMERGAHYAIHDHYTILGEQFYVPLDAWFSVALGELHKVQPKKEYADYCLMLTDMELNDQMAAKWQIFYPDYDGGYWPYPPGGTPAGSRAEGITACCEAAQRAGYDVRELKERIRKSARFQLERMVRPEFAHLYPNSRRALGAIRSTPVGNVVRIDANQHNISSLLVAARILGD
jgi:hypothetical protein